jgi:hypothetical protein
MFEQYAYREFKAFVLLDEAKKIIALLGGVVKHD